MSGHLSHHLCPGLLALIPFLTDATHACVHMHGSKAIGAPRTELRTYLIRYNKVSKNVLKKQNKKVSENHDTDRALLYHLDPLDHRIRLHIDEIMGMIASEAANLSETSVTWSGRLCRHAIAMSR